MFYGQDTTVSSLERLGEAGWLPDVRSEESIAGQACNQPAARARPRRAGDRTHATRGHTRDPTGLRLATAVPRGPRAAVRGSRSELGGSSCVRSPSRRSVARLLSCRESSVCPVPGTESFHRHFNIQETARIQQYIQ
jgi:hypothetical protein